MGSSKTERGKATQNRLIAVSDPLRAKILRILVERTASPAEMGRQLGQPTPNVSYHAKRLVELDCAELVEERKVQGSIQHFYRATERALVSTEEWEEMDPLEGQGFLAEIMQLALDDFLASQREELIGEDANFHLTRDPICLDEEGLLEGLKILERAREALFEVQRESVERNEEGNNPSYRLTSLIGLFKVPSPKSS